MISVSLLYISRQKKIICRILQESPHLQSHLLSLTYDIQIHDVVICVSLLNISRKPPPGASCFLNLHPQAAIAFISVQFGNGEPLYNPLAFDWLN